MRLLSSVAALALLIAAGCSTEDGASSPRAVPEIALEAAVYAGELVLRADSALLAPGAAATISVVFPGRDEPLLSRSYDLGDPIWRLSRDEARLYFALDDRDAWPGIEGGVQRDMELVARFDPDGNPATDEPGSVRVRVPVATGSPSILIEVALALPVAANSREDSVEPASDR